MDQHTERGLSLIETFTKLAGLGAEWVMWLLIGMFTEALVATAVGLLVAIPSVVSFNWFKALLKQRINNTDFLTRLVVAPLKRDDRGPRALSIAAAAAEEE